MSAYPRRTWSYGTTGGSWCHEGFGLVPHQMDYYNSHFHHVRILLNVQVRRQPEVGGTVPTCRPDLEHRSSLSTIRSLPSAVSSVMAPVGCFSIAVAAIFRCRLRLHQRSQWPGEPRSYLYASNQVNQGSVTRISRGHLVGGRAHGSQTDTTRFAAFETCRPVMGPGYQMQYSLRGVAC